MTGIDPDLRRRLTVRRIALGLTQRELAERAGLAKCQISYLENGLTNPQLPTVQRWVEGLGLQLVIDVEPAPTESEAAA